MSTRYTRKDVENFARRLANMLDIPMAESWNHVGAWRIDFAGCYGGYVIEEVTNESGGIRHPLGSRRRSAREMCEAISFACDALWIVKDREQ